MHRFSTLIAAAALLAAAGAARSEEPAVLDAPLEGLLISECFTAANSLLRQADKAKDASEWAKAIEIYQEVLREYPDSLFALGPESLKDRKGVAYVNAAEYVEEMLGGLPDEARLAYASLYEPRAKALLDSCKSADETGPLAQAASLYPVTPSGMNALGLLARIDLQNARWAAAGTRFRALLMRDRFHWDRREPEILSLAVALVREGRDESILQLASEVQGRVGGDRGKALRTRLEAMSRHAAGAVEAPVWLGRFGVDAPGLGAVRSGPVEFPKSWQSAAPPLTSLANQSGFNQFQNQDGFVVDQTLLRRWKPYFPAMAGDRLFVHNGIECRCHDLIFGGSPVWTFESDYGRASRGAERVVGNTNFEPSRIFTVTVDKDLVYILMEVPSESLGLSEKDYHGYQVIPPIPRRRLVALDVRNGRKIFEAGCREQPLTFFDKISFTTEPLAQDGRLYIAGALFEGIPTAYVFCLDSQTGAQIWTRRIATGSQELNMFGRPVREYCGSPISMRGDSIYFCTNLGAVACLNAADGRFKWVFRYKPVQKTKSVNFQTFKTPPSWFTSPIVAAADRIVVAPADSDHLFALSPESGSLIWSVDGKPRWGSQQRAGGGHDHAYLLGVVDSKVIAHGSFTAAYHLRSGQTAWQHRFATQGEFSAGMGAIAGGMVYIPSETAIYVLDGRTGKTLGREPFADAASEAGNVAVAGGCLVTLTQHRINCFYDKKTLLDRIIADARSRTDDPSAALRAAWICLRNGRLDHALDFFGKAKAKAPPGSEIAADVEHGLFRAYMDMGAEDWKAGLKDKALVSFRKALEHAPGEQEKITATLRILEHHRRVNDDAAIERTYRELASGFPAAEYAFEGDPLSVRTWARMGLARHFDVAGKPDLAVVEYQSIIEREPGTPFRVGMKAGSAGELAQAEIESVISKKGRAPYAVFDERAARLLAEGKSARSIESLEAVRARYPNSLSCAPALLEVARIHAASGRPAAAEEALKRHLRDFPSSPAAADVLAMLAAVLEKLGQMQGAKLVLLRLREKYPDAQVDDGSGGRKSASAWAGAKLASDEFRTIENLETRPDVDWQKGKIAWKALVPSNHAIIPLRGVRQLEYGPMILVRSVNDRSEDEISAWSGRDGALLWSVKTHGERYEEGHFCGDTLLLGGQYKVIGLDPSTGAEKWTRPFPQGSMVRGLSTVGKMAALTVNGIDGKSLHLWALVIDTDTGRDLFEPRSLEQWGGRSQPVLGAEVMVAYIREGTARVFGFDLLAGRRLFSREVGDLLNSPPVLFEQASRTVFATRQALVGLDLSGGEKWSLTLGPVERNSLVAASGLAVCARTTDRGFREMVAADPATGRIAWRADTQLHSIRFMDVTGGGLFVQGRRGVEWRLMRFDCATGALSWSAIVGDQSSSIVTTMIGATCAVAKVSGPLRGALTSGDFVFIDLKTGKASRSIPFLSAPASDGFTLVDGMLVWSEEDGLKAFGG